jgi:hypothetical protein
MQYAERCGQSPQLYFSVRPHHAFSHVIVSPAVHTIARAEAVRQLRAEHLVRVDSNGVLYMVGVAQTTDGLGWFDQAMLFCPFCGAALQTREDIKAAPPL